MRAPILPDILIVVTLTVYIYVSSLGITVRRDCTHRRIECEFPVPPNLFLSLILTWKQPRRLPSPSLRSSIVIWFVESPRKQLARKLNTTLAFDQTNAAGLSDRAYPLHPINLIGPFSPFTFGLFIPFDRGSSKVTV